MPHRSPRNGDGSSIHITPLVTASCIWIAYSPLSTPAPGGRFPLLCGASSVISFQALESCSGCTAAINEWLWRCILAPRSRCPRFIPIAANKISFLVFINGDLFFVFLFCAGALLMLVNNALMPGFFVTGGAAQHASTRQLTQSSTELFAVLRSSNAREALRYIIRSASRSGSSYPPRRTRAFPTTAWLSIPDAQTHQPRRRFACVLRHSDHRTTIEPQHDRDPSTSILVHMRSSPHFTIHDRDDRVARCNSLARRRNTTRGIESVDAVGPVGPARARSQRYCAWICGSQS